MAGVWDDMKQAGQGIANFFGGQQTAQSWGNGFDQFRQGAHSVWGTIAGDAQHPGIFGTGQFHTDAPTIDQSAAQLPGYQQMQQQAAQGAMAAGQRTAPTMQAAQMQGATINTGPQDQFRNAQAGLMSQLQAQANGTGPSLAQGQLQAGTDRNLAQAYALASANPTNAATARDVANQRADISQQGAQQASQLRLQEQQQAQNMLGQVAAGARGQDLSLAGDQANLSQQANMQNAGFQQQAGANNQNAQLQQQANNDTMVRYYQSMGMSLAEAQQQANMQMQQLIQQGQLGAAGINAGAYANAANANAKLAGGILGGIGGGLATGATGGAAGLLKGAGGILGGG